MVTSDSGTFHSGSSRLKCDMICMDETKMLLLLSQCKKCNLGLNLKQLNLHIYVETFLKPIKSLHMHSVFWNFRISFICANSWEQVLMWKKIVWKKSICIGRKQYIIFELSVAQRKNLQLKPKCPLIKLYSTFVCLTHAPGIVKLWITYSTIMYKVAANNF